MIPRGIRETLPGRFLATGVLALVALAGSRCEPVNRNASTGVARAVAPTNTATMSNWQLCQSPSCDALDGSIPFLVQTPAIYLPDGSSTFDECVAVEQESLRIRETYCAGCHQAPAINGGMNFVLNDQALAGAFSQTATLADGGPQRLLIVGDPLDSRLYQLVAAGVMPPTSLTGGASIPRPTAADLSSLYGWILSCANGADGGGYVIGGGNYAPDAATTADSGLGLTDAGILEPIVDAAPPVADADTIDSGSSSDANVVAFGEACTSASDCAAPFPACYAVNGVLGCTKACKGNGACPTPETSGVCKAGYCQ